MPALIHTIRNDFVTDKFSTKKNYAMSYHGLR